MRRKKGTGRYFERDGQYRCRWRTGRRDIERVAGPAERDAIYLLERIERVMGRHRLSLEDALAHELGEPRPTGYPPFSNLLDFYLDWCDQRQELRPRTRKTNRERAGILKGAPWASAPVGSFGRKKVREWVAQRQAAGTSGKTILNDLVLASSAWKWADDEELLDPDWENPFARSRPRRFAKKERRALEPAELRALGRAIEATEPAIYPLFLATIFSGWRAGELGGLREAELHLDDPNGPCMTIAPHEEKTAKDKTAFIGEPLVGILRTEREELPRLPTAYVFTDERGRPWTRKTRITRFRKALATVPEKEIPTWKRIPDNHHVGLDWHTLRHSVKSLLSARGHRDAVVGELMGQADVTTQRRYDHAYVTEAAAIAND
ncbi:MAG: tyrosine-type recombinase/integrase, partial [Planctomycetota bacterium]